MHPLAEPRDEVLVDALAQAFDVGGVDEELAIGRGSERTRAMGRAGERQTDLQYCSILRMDAVSAAGLSAETLDGHRNSTAHPR